jgi:hypothetical protein
VCGSFWGVEIFFKMAAVAMVTKVQNGWLPNHGYQFPTSKSTWKPNFDQIGRIFVFWRPFWIQNGRHSKPTMDINSQHHNRYKMVAKYKNPPIWEKFGFQVDYDVANWYSSLVCYGARNRMKLSRNFVWRVHIILRLTNFRMVAVATKNVKNLSKY